jgi:glycosyltransferase involved in cell wall biosynthesis
VAQGIASWLVLVAHVLERELAPSCRARARVVYNGVTVRPPVARAVARQALANRLKLPAWDSNLPLFVSLSSLVPFKGIHHLLTAAAMTRDMGVDAHFALAGTGLDDAYERWLQTRWADLKLSGRVHFLGFVDDTHELLCAADALVLPSVEWEDLPIDGRVRLDVRCTEGLPRSILEAMAAALPVIATKVGGVPEQIDDGRTGVLVPPSDPTALAEAIRRVALDGGWREEAGNRGREVVLERFTVASAAQGLADVLRLGAAGRPLLARGSDLGHLFREGLVELAMGSRKLLS